MLFQKVASHAPPVAADGASNSSSKSKHFRDKLNGGRKLRAPFCASAARGEPGGLSLRAVLIRSPGAETPPRNSLPGSAGPWCPGGRPRTRKILALEYDHGQLCRCRQLADVVFHVEIRLRPLLHRGFFSLLAGLDGSAHFGPKAHVLRPGLGGLFGSRFILHGPHSLSASWL